MFVLVLIGAASCAKCAACQAFQSGQMKCVFYEKSVDAKCDGLGKWVCAMKLSTKYTRPGPYHATGTCHNTTLKCPIDVWDVKIEKEHYTISQCIGVCGPDDTAHEQKESRKRLAIGLGVGLGGAAVIAVVIIVICWKKKREGAKAEPPQYTG
jgi:hypothetical protein